MKTKSYPLAYALLGCIALMSASSASAVDPISKDKDYAFSLYGGRISDGSLSELVSGKANYVDSDLVAGALSWTFKRAESKSWSLELEGNVAKQTGTYSHWEFNALLTGRWNRFPWSDMVATTIALGLGTSYATKVSVADTGSSNRLVGFGQVELTLGPPKGDWAVLFRVHHRSTAGGVFGDNVYGDRGETNALTAGIRYYF